MPRYAFALVFQVDAAHECVLVLGEQESSSCEQRLDQLKVDAITFENEALSLPKSSVDQVHEPPGICISGHSQLHSTALLLRPPKRACHFLG